jgi:thiamine-monophosphate kinase
MIEEQYKRTELSELGEFGLIDHLTHDLKIKNRSTVKGVGDDAAIIDNGGKLTLVSKDLLVENIHFDLTYTPLKHLGYKAAIVNFSDIYAMNGTPKQLIVGMAVSNKYSLEAVEDIYSGIIQACEKYGVDIVGGDTTSSNSGLFISITVIGEADHDTVVLRSTAQDKDLICVCGNLGAAYMGLLLLEREKAVYKANPEMQPDLEGHDYILQRQLKPEAQKKLIEDLKKAGVKPTSMIDISDGLASEVLHLCNDSDKGCNIYEEKIPIDHETCLIAEEFNISPVTAALSGGEDYEILFTVSQKDYEKVKNVENISFIGYITEKSSGSNLITNAGQAIPITAQGWDAIKR